MLLKIIDYFGPKMMALSKWVEGKLMPPVIFAFIVFGLFVAGLVIIAVLH